MSHSKDDCCQNQSETENDQKTQTVSSDKTKKMNILTKIIIVMIRFYQLFLSPLKPKTCGCRFRPTCSEYAKSAFLLHGPLKGAMLTVIRLARCHPWGGSGYDPVPPRKEKHQTIRL